MPESSSSSGREPAPFLRWPDLRRLGALVVGGAAACVVPRRCDVALTGAWFGLYRLLAPRTLDRIAARMERHLPEPPPGGSYRAVAEQHARARIEDMWGRVRGLHRRGFRPSIEVEGLEHARAALKRGRGVLVWAMRVGSATVIKQGFCNSGLPLVHLSRAEHGSPTLTRLGVGVVAPLYRRGEDAVLGERVQIPLDGSLGYLRTIGDRLASNRCVSIFGEHPGRQSVEVNVLGVRRPFALGAPSLAWRHDSGLVTAYALREGSFRYRVVVEEEMAVDRDMPRRRFAEGAVHEFAGRLERAVVRHPADWQAWFYLDQYARQTGAESERP